MTGIGVGFDFDHTLGIDNKLERVAFLRLLEFLLGEGGRALGTLAEESARIDALLALQRSGAFPIDEAVGRFVRERAPASNVAQCVERYKSMAVHSVGDFVIPMPGARELFDTLASRGIPSAILTNGWDPLQKKKAERIGFIGPVVVSETIGAQKPSRRAFDMLSEALGRPDAIWYVGDNPATDVVASIGAGMNGVWFDAEQAGYPSGVSKPTATIHALADLPALFPGALTQA